MKDLKEALGSGLKPDVTHVRTPLMVYTARACEYGSDKYERANFLRRTPGGRRSDFLRLREYARATVSHLMKALDSMEAHQANDPELRDLGGMVRACYAADEEAGSSFPASGLPHWAHAAASLNMALAQAVDVGLLPADPGQPWARMDDLKGYDTGAKYDAVSDEDFVRGVMDEFDLSDVEPNPLDDLEVEPNGFGKALEECHRVFAEDVAARLKLQEAGLCRLCSASRPEGLAYWCEACLETDAARDDAEQNGPEMIREYLKPVITEATDADREDFFADVKPEDFKAEAAPLPEAKSAPPSEHLREWRRKRGYCPDCGASACEHEGETR